MNERFRPFCLTRVTPLPTIVPLITQLDRVAIEPCDITDLANLMNLEIVVPEEVPVMTLPNIAFFPQALLPLHIFEPRYRQMLADALTKDRLMAVVGLDQDRLLEANSFEPPHRVATVGIIRACQKNGDGTSNLLLQGICRVEITHIAAEEPYRIVTIRALNNQACNDPKINAQLRVQLAKLLELKRTSGAKIPAEITDFLQTVEDPDIFVDLAAFSLCEDASLKQTLLETLDVRTRLELFNQQLLIEIEGLQLHKTLQGDLPDNRISEN